MPHDHDKAELIAELARARVGLAENAVALRRDLDFPARAKKAFKSGPLPWLGSAAVVGLIVARLAPGRRTKKVVVTRKAEPVLEKAGKAGLILGVLKMLLDFARPAVTAWARKRVTDYIAARQAQGDLRR